jgi:hypothetical protein
LRVIPVAQTVLSGKPGELCETSRVHLTSSTGARPSGRFNILTEVNETIDGRAGGAEAA